MPLEIFRSLADAKAAGYEPYDRAPTVFLVRKEDRERPSGWKLAAVQLMFTPGQQTETR